MKLSDEFNARYTCDMPEHLPEAFAERLHFLSCLRKEELHSVYLVQDKGSCEKQILKITESGAPNNLEREYSLLSKLEHQGIPRAIAYDSDDGGRAYLLRTYADGNTLKDLLERDGVFSQRQTLEIALKICEIVEYLHGRTPPVIYRDITPDNVVITPNGKLSLIDFGISREDTNEKGFDTVYVGSTAFASPEQFGFTKTDRRSDIFTIGKLMLYLATGQTGLRTCTEYMEPGGLQKIVTKCTQLSPEKRYASVSQLTRAIGRQLAPPTRREYATAAVCAALVLAIGVTVGIHFLTAPSQEASLPPAPVHAGGDEVADEVKIPVRIQVQNNGNPFSDCAVAVDNHHWYGPDTNGTAELLVYAFDNYNIKAAAGNRTAVEAAAVTRDSSDLSFTLDLALVPEAPELLTLEFPFGERHEVPLAAAGADTVTFSGAPPGVSVAQLSTGFSLIAENVELPGRYTIFAECANEYGTAEMVISLNLTTDQEAAYIHTAQELDRMRENLSGYYVLANNIDLSGTGSWTPVGVFAHPFTGIFDGNGYKITGLAVYGHTGDVGLFGTCERAAIKNVVLQNPKIQAADVSAWGVGAVAGSMDKGMIENCTVFGGTIIADTSHYSSVGGICGRNGGVILNSHNEAEVRATDVGRSESDTIAGGICGENMGYIAGCGNTGSISNSATPEGLAGGIAGFCDRGIIAHCYNTGTVNAPNYWGHYPPGGIVHLLGRGKRIYDCTFQIGSAPVGATVWNGGVLQSLQPLTAEKMQDWIDNHTQTRAE